MPRTRKLPSSMPPAATVDLSTLLRQARQQEPLKLVLCGDAGAGKTALLTRLLSDLPAGAGRHAATPPHKPAWAQDTLLLASAGHAGGDNILTHYQFATAHGAFVVADPPGQETALRDLVAAASTADLAILVIDAAMGIGPATRRQAYLLSLLGVHRVALVINKLDLVPSPQLLFDQLVSAFQTFTGDLHGIEVIAIPVNALNGDNLARRATTTPWYRGPTLLGLLETAQPAAVRTRPLAFPVQLVNNASAGFIGYSGTVAEGQVRVGDLVRANGSGQTSSVSGIVTMDGVLDCASQGDAVTLTLSDPITVVRGDVLALSDQPLETTDQFEATLVWTDADPGLIGRSYDLKLATQQCTASITNIKYRVEVGTLKHEAAKNLALNDIAVCNIAAGKTLVFDQYQNSPVLGSFLLIDRVSRATVALGMIRHNLRRAQNVHRQTLTVTAPDRARLNGHTGKVIWFTGLSGSGKSTIANALEVALHALGRHTYLLDGDNIRLGLNKDLGFTDADRVENIRRIAEVAKLMLDAGLIVLASFISPFRRERAMVRELIGADRFREVYVSTSLAVCEQRDVKGLYRKARNGQLPNMTGISSPYEAPLQADVELDGGHGSVDDAVQRLLEQLTL
jgi:bifunctional enzyme CysN/CysC